VLRKRTFILASVTSSVLLGTTAPVQAQNAAPQSSSAVMEEIIVTARKREESGQDVPIAVTVMNADAIYESGMLTVPDLTRLNPSVSFDTAQSFQRNSLKIRGIGTLGNSRTFEGAVGVFVDGVYRSRSGMALGDLLDIRQLEVLRGPQSTLFGKNTVAGAISLSSARPDRDESFAEIRTGNLGLSYLAGAINAEASDTLAFRFSGNLHKRDAFFTSPDNGDGYDNVDRFGLKAQMLLTPHDDLEVWLVADHAESDSHCCWGSAIVEAGPTAPLIDVYSSLNGLTFVAPPAGEDSRSASLNTLPGEKIEDGGLMARVQWNVGDITVSSTSSFRYWEHNQINADVDYVAADLLVLNEPAKIDSISQELTALLPFGPNGRNELLLGFYFAQEDYESVVSVETGGDADNYVNALASAAQGAVACLPGVIAVDCLFPVGIDALFQDGLVTRSAFQQDSETLALYAHMSFELTDKLNLTAGLRHSLEDKSGSVDNQFWYDSAIVRAVLALAGIPDDGTPRNGLDLIGTLYSPSFTADIRDDESTGLITLSYDINDDVMVYGGYHRGYKAGGVNLFREGVVSNSTTYDPETADSIEIGIKAQYWDGRARSNIAAFDTRFTDLQINFFTGLEFRTENTGKATTRGIEFENSFLLTDRLQVDFSATYLDARFGELGNPFLAYLDNRDTPRAPDWAAVASVMYERALNGSRELFVRGFASYAGSHIVGAEIPDEAPVSSYIITDATIGIRGNDDMWEASIWCSNCGDQDYRTIFFNTTFQPGSFSSYLNAPRQYGASVRFRF